MKTDLKGLASLSWKQVQYMAKIQSVGEAAVGKTAGEVLECTGTVKNDRTPFLAKKG